MSTKTLVRALVLACIVLAFGAGIFAMAARRPAIEPVAQPPASTFDPDLVKRGSELAAIGNCAVCHTAPGGREFAGGRAVPTPFGTIYSTNITPDPQTGIGNWSPAAFSRAMRYGVRRDGAYLYPAFPYDHFTLVSDSDNEAIYAFLMTKEPVRTTPPDNQLPMSRSVGTCCFCIRAPSVPTAITTRHGIAAPISSVGLVTAAPAIRREISWRRKSPANDCPAARRKAGRPTR